MKSTMALTFNALDALTHNISSAEYLKERDTMATKNEIENAQQLREAFLQDADQIVTRIKKAYTDRTGDAQLTAQEETVMKQIWPTLEKIILSVEDTHKREANNAKEVLTLIRQGKMSVDDGIKFMALFKLEAEIVAIEKTGSLSSEGNVGGITIMLSDQTANKEVKEINEKEKTK